MKTSPQGIKLIEHFEGNRLKPYLDSVGIPTIGIGMTRYPNGKKVTMKDKALTPEQSISMFTELLKSYEADVTRLLGSTKVTQNQFDALVAFQYNTGGLAGSTLLKLIKANGNPKKIWGAFIVWDKVKADRDGKDNDGDGLIDEPGEMKEELGLLRRRNAEAHLFVMNKLEFYENLTL